MSSFRTHLTCTDSKLGFPISSELTREAFTMILNSESPNEEDLDDQRFLEIFQEATDLYGLLHARFIQTPKGMAIMREKILNGVFGVCPRLLCGGQNVVPIGMDESTRHSRVKVYCPRCGEVYLPKKKCDDIDGAYFGPSFPFLLIKTYPDLVPKEKLKRFEPTIYGFKLHKQASASSLPVESIHLDNHVGMRKEKK